MSEKIIYDLLLRASSDPDFKQKMEADPAGTIKRLGLDLSQEEIAELCRALKQEEAKASFGLDQRLSKSGISLSPQAMLRQKGGIKRRDGGYDEVRKAPGDLTNNHGRHKIGAEYEKSIDEPDYEVERG